MSADNRLPEKVVPDEVVDQWYQEWSILGATQDDYSLETHIATRACEWQLSAQRFINDRARLEHALRICLKKLGVDANQQELIVAEVKNANFFLLAAIQTQETPHDH
jgi:hypothetical protein